jgi:hypothetical protein
MAASDHRIAFIYNYCDRWCERCGFTDQCSAFAARAAIAMTGDAVEGMELAVGTPTAETESRTSDGFSDELDFEVMPDDIVDFVRHEQARAARVDNDPVIVVAEAFASLANHWLRSGYERIGRAADFVVKEALDVAAYDATFILVKLTRALDGLDRHEKGDEDDAHPIQNDWNGSAKVALISIERSEAAWRVIAESTGEETPLSLSDCLLDLLREVEHKLPNARSFVRPGFDE